MLKKEGEWNNRFNIDNSKIKFEENRENIKMKFLSSSQSKIKPLENNKDNNNSKKLRNRNNDTSLDETGRIMSGNYEFDHKQRAKYEAFVELLVGFDSHDVV